MRKQNQYFFKFKLGTDQERNLFTRISIGITLLVLYSSYELLNIFSIFVPVKKRPTLIDIAKKANVSIGTVDRTLHNRGRVAQATKERIFEIAKEIGYQKNLHASILAKNKKEINLAYLLPKKGMDPFWDLVLEGVNEAIEELQMASVHSNYFSFDLFDPEDFLLSFSQLESQSFDAVLTAPIFDKEWKHLESELERLEIPFTLINTSPKVVGKQFIGFIGPDALQSGRLAGSLIGKHCAPKDVVIMLPLEKDYSNARHMKEKEKGLRSYLKDNYPEVEFLIYNFENYGDQIELTLFLEKISTQYPRLRGIYTSASRTHLIASCLERLGWTDKILVGYDALPKNIPHLQAKRITYLINQNPKLMGYLGMKRIQKYSLFNLIEREDIYIPLDVILPENLTYYKNSIHPLRYAEVVSAM